MSSSNTIIRYRETVTCLLAYANQNRSQDLFNDVTIRTNTNQSISANRMVLSCYSKYFETMFKTQMKEKYQSSVTVKGVDGKSLELLINYIYTGQVSINSKNLTGLLSGADYLQLDDVKEFCFEFMEMELTPNNCLTFLNMAKLYRSDLLKKKILNYISENYELLINTEGFKNLTKDDLVKSISMFCKNPKKQPIICKSILLWTKYDKPKRSGELNELLNLVDFKQLPLSDVNNIVYDELIQENMACLKSVINQLMDLLSTKKCFDAESKILCIGGTNNARNVLQVYSLSDQSETIYPQLPIPFQDHCSLKHGNFVYCIGGESEEEFLKLVIRMNLNEENLYWSPIAPLKQARATFGAAVFNNALVVAGGRNQDKNELESAEVYKMETNEWTTIASLNIKRQGNQLVACDGSLFALGGFDGNESTSSVERLDDVNDEWYDVAPMHEARRIFSAVSRGGFIYVLGGLDQNNKCSKTVEMYDPRLNAWTCLSDMNSARYDHCACVFRDHIIVIGGLNLENDVSSIEFFIPSHNKWHIKKNVEKTIQEHSLVVI